MLGEAATGHGNLERHMPLDRRGRRRRALICEAEFVAQDLVAMGCADVVLIEPALAAQFTRRRREMRGYRAGDLIAQIEIAADALVVLAVEAEKGFGVVQVDGVFDLTALGHSFGVVVRQVKYTVNLSNAKSF